MRCEIDGRAVQSLDEIYDALAGALAFPAHFGRNLDALRDVLTTDLPGPIEIVVTAAEAARRRLGRDFDRLAEVLRAAAAERADLSVTFA
jgi:ribonuclease inhibitor